MAWFRKQKNAALVQQPGKHRLTLAEIAMTGGSLRIREMSNNLWFPFGQPIPSVAPKGTPPRRTAFQPMANINFSGRQGQIGFGELRRFSHYTICRAIIEAVLDRLCSEKWDFRIVKEEGEKPSEYKKRNANDPRLAALRAFFKKPDGWQNFRTWSRGLYDDMLVIDAASVWLQKDQSGKIASLVQIDGAQVFPLVDETGQQPDPNRVLVQTNSEKADKSYLTKVKAKGGNVTGGNGSTAVQGGSPAFQLTPYGFPAQEMTAKELVYAVRNRKTYAKYGLSIVEQALAMIALGLGRQDFQAAYYTSGNVPEFIAFLPPDVPVSKAEELNGYLDSVLAGQSSKRRKGFFLPSYGSDKQPNIIFPKQNDEVLKDMFDEWIARVLCFFFGMSPTAFIKQVNRATAEQMSAESEEQGLQPYLDWMKDLLDEIVQFQFGWDDIEGVTETRKEQDATKQAGIDDIQVRTGVKALDEIRTQNGDDPWGLPETKGPVVITATGIVTWDGTPLSNAPPPPKIVGPDGKPPSLSAPPNGKPPGGGNGKQPPKGPKGKTEKADSRHNWPTLSPGILSSKSQAARVRLETEVRNVFTRARDAAVRGVSGIIARPAKPKSKKASVRKDGDDDNQDELKNGIESELWDDIRKELETLPTRVRQPLEDAGLSGVHEAVLELSFDDTGLINNVNSQAAEYARNRAAELVGMSQDEDGNFIPNANAEWTITDTTRDDLRRIVTDAFQGETDFNTIIAKIKDALMGERIFSDARAKMIARTEIGRAQAGSGLDLWKQSGLIKTIQWDCEGDNPCPFCLMNDGEQVAFGEPFPSGAFSTLDSHPQCQCLVYAVDFNE